MNTERRIDRLREFCLGARGPYYGISADIGSLLESYGAAQKDAERLKWLHTEGGKDTEGYEWGVARVKFDAQGRVVSSLWTFSDHSDLDAEMRREQEAANL